MKKLLYLIPALLLVGTLFYACQEQNVVEPNKSSIEKVDVGNLGSGVSCVELTAGQTINTGSVCFDDIDTDGDNIVDALKICYTTINGWELVEAHFWIGTTLSQLPMTKSGNPIPGQFPYKSGNITGQTEYCIIIPFSEINFECPGPTKYIVAAHAALRKVENGVIVDTQTGWGAGTRITTKGNWGTYFNIWITCDETTPPGKCDETAFAKSTSSICFDQYPDFIDNPKRWGWTNGPLTQGVYTMELWAAAGQCNTSNGTNVGTVTVNFDGTSAVVTYSVNAPYSLSGVHLYVGCDPLPEKCTGPSHNQNCDYTLAPGQYPIKAENLANGTTSWSYTVTNLGCDIFVVAHADVFGFDCE